MNNRFFQAMNWLDSTTFDKADRIERDLPPLPILPSEEKQSVTTSSSSSSPFALGQFLIPEWKGESLFSKETMRVKRLLEHLFNDSLEQIEGFQNRNRSGKLSVYNEFIAYAHEMGINHLYIDTFNDFWESFSDPYSPDRETIDNFKKVYAFRAITVYLFKIRFFTLIGKELNLNLLESDFLTPDYCLRKIFKKGSSTEINCEALETNQYSWYRPSSSLKEKIYNVAFEIEKTSLAEVLKLCRPETFNLGDIVQKEQYSHSLSTKVFGMFLNQLMIEVPAWLEGRKLGQRERSIKGPKAVNTYFSGQYLQSLSSAHWLAQEHNASVEWSEILCPDFMGDNYTEGHFLKICHELHFLSFLVYLSKSQGHSPVALICSMFKQKMNKNLSNDLGQIDLFGASGDAELTYDRVLLNLVHLPKKNPHHFMINKVNQTSKKLSSKGYLYLFSNQKLFVPSQSEKVEQFLQNYKIEARFSFEDLKGKGEIPNFLYIIKKRAMLNINRASELKKTQKESCLSFKFHGPLSQFGKFQSFVKELFNFTSQKNPQTTPIFQSEPAEELSFQFHQDAILEGKLLSSTTSNPDQHTHPNYFKNLMKSCVPLDQFFTIENLNGEVGASKNITSELLGITFKQEERYPFLLIIDFSNNSEIKIELTSSDLYRAKLEQNGMAYFQYFGLIPKRADININLFREFFSTSIGKQVIQLSLNGGLTKIKSKLRALLIPKFFMDNTSIPRHLEPTMKFLSTTEEELLSTHPDRSKDHFKQVENFLGTISKKYPWHTLSLLSNFKYHLESCMRSAKSNEVNFFNPLIQAPLCELNTSPIYPNNKDIFLNIVADNPQDIHSSYTSCNLVHEEDGDSLEVLADGKVIITLHGELLTLNFIKFILTNAAGAPISTLIQGLRIPTLSDLQSVVENYKNISSVIERMHSSSNQMISGILSSQISSPSNNF